VLGIAFGIMFGGLLIRNFIPYILYALPLSMDSIALAIVQGVRLPAMFVSQVITTAILSIVFILAALWRFQHKEF
jgi:putative Mn2+ efflux pump MntP